MLEAAFPRCLRPEVTATLEVVPPAEHQPASPFHVLVASEPVTIPYRIYSDEPSPDRQRALSVVERAVLDCLYTRHHDGRVRQRRLELVIRLVEPWVVPFVVHLIGEYVEEILVVIQQNLRQELETPGSFVETVYGQFAAENPKFVELTSQRAASYWDCYYSRRYPRLIDYPGHALATALQAAASRHRAATTAGLTDSRRLP